MRAHSVFAVAMAAVLVAFCLPLDATTNVVPTTTLTAETSNNTSAASSFTTKTDGDIAPGNVSKVPTKTLLYSGFSSPIYVHFQAWFGGKNHMDVGYTSDDATQVHAQISDMLSRGLAGMVIDWYGTSHTSENNTAILVMQDAETRGGQFVFAVALDGGALASCAATAGCSVTQTTINDLNYAYTEFEQSLAYMKIGGRPVIPTFGTEFYSIDWATVRASVNGNPLFIFRNSGGFSAPETNGGYSWVAPTTTDPTNMELGYLDNFYKTSLGFPAEVTFGSGYKGFNDTLASWGTGRIIDQFCGQTWLDSVAEIGKYYNSSSTKPPNAIQLVTWNDYEEGTEIETGIDNCVSISASWSTPMLNWSITGNENTIDRYTIFVSTDGQNLMPLADVPAGTHSYDMSGGWSFPAGQYIFFVKAVGKPSMLNHMSNSLTFNFLGDWPPVVNLALSGGMVTPAKVTANTAGTRDPDGAITAETIDFGDGSGAVSVSGGGMATHTYNTAGNYTITVSATDNAGLTTTTRQTANILAPYVVIGEPMNGATLPPNFPIAAQGFSGNPITSMQIYVDGTLVDSASSTSTISTTLSLKIGTHNLTVKAFDILGNYSSSVTVKVSVHPCFLSPPLTPLGPSGKIGMRFLPCMGG